MHYTTELLDKISQLTLIREEDALMDAFLKLMLEQFESIQGVGLFKLEFEEQLILKLKASQFSSMAKTQLFTEELFSNSLLKLLQDSLVDSALLQSSIQIIDGQPVLIHQSHRDKTALYFLVYWFSDSEACVHQSGFIPSVLLKNQNEHPLLKSIRSLSDIYTNHQAMIFYNDKDSLTGLSNRKSFDRIMYRCYTNNEHPFRRFNEAGKDDFLAIMDIDHFKKVNDTYGHLYGDEVLIHFAQQMQKIFREQDGLFRYGGEEFIVILKNVDTETAQKVLHRFRRHIESYNFPKIEMLTVSIGFTQLRISQMQSEIVDRADTALYYVKQHGRNNVGCYEQLLKENRVQEIIPDDDIELF